MNLGGQGASLGQHGHARGFAMAALLVGMSIMAILMGAALPVWNKQAQREKEEEYLFRANEYARAIMKFRAKVANATPPNFDVLVQQRFLRRKYKDPITGQDFQPVYQTATPAGQLGGPGGARPGTITPAGGGASTFGQPGGTPTGGTGGTPTAGTGTPVPGAGVIGVVSKSKATSIKIYNGRTRYDQWAVTYMDVKPGKGWPPDLLQAMNAAARAGANGQPGGGGAGNPFGGPGTATPGQFGQPGGAGNRGFGTPVQPGGFGQQPGQQPFGVPGQAPFGQPSGAAGQPPTGGPGGFTPMYPPPPAVPGAPVFGTPPKRPPPGA